MSRDFGEIYREIEELDPVHGLDQKSLHVSAEIGLEWKSPPDYRALGLTQKQLLELYYYMVLMREVDNEHDKLYRANLVHGKHLPALGNEATAIGAAYALKKQDWLTFAIRDLGAFLVRGVPLYQILGQAMGRVSGPTKGWDGILHMGDKALRAIGLISHLGTMLPIAVGCSFSEKYRATDGIALAFSGEGATSTGDVHEGLNIASVLRVPMIVVIENNQWAFGTPTRLQYAVPTLALRSLGYGRHVAGYLIDGTNVITAFGTVKQAAEDIRLGRYSMVIIETRSMRMLGHSIADNFKYVPTEQLEEWKRKDPIAQYTDFLLTGGIAGQAELDAIVKRIRNEIDEAVAMAEKSPMPDGSDIETVVFTQTPLHPVQLSDPPREGKRLTYHEAIQEALREEMDRDPDLFIIGEDIGVSGGAFKITEGFTKRYDKINWNDYWRGREPFAQRRVIDAPIAEAGFTGLAFGAILNGLKVVVEFQYADFASEAYKMLVNYGATQTVRGMGPVPVVCRLPAGWEHNTSLYHSINPEIWFAPNPGLKIVAPVTAFDAKGLMKAAIRDGNIVLYLEYKGKYRIPPEKLPPELNLPVPEHDYVVPIGKGRIVKPGTDMTVITYGSQLFRVLDAVHRVEQEDGVSVEVIDLRSIIPWDKELVLASVEKTSRALVTWEAPLQGSFGNEIAAHIGEWVFGHLDAPVKRVAAANTPPVPFSPPLEEAHLPTTAKLVTAIRELISH